MNKVYRLKDGGYGPKLLISQMTTGDRVACPGHIGPQVDGVRGCKEEMRK